MAASSLPCPTIVRLLLRYEPETGALTWRPRPAFLFARANNCEPANRSAAWNRRFVGNAALKGPAGTSGEYRSGRLLSNFVLAHRVAWCIHYGRWPAGELDHINKNGADNRITNLRPATKAQNSWNRTSSGPKQQASRYKGVTLERKSGLWLAKIRVNGRRLYLGRFACEEDAALAYDAAARVHFGAFASPNFV
jgi:hypothetical protein